MAMNKQRKLLIGVLCLGLGGLAVDRFVLGSPESAAADDDVITIEAPIDPQPTAQQASTSTSASSGEPVKALPSYASLTQRLVEAQQQVGELPQIEPNSDPFAMPQQWRVEEARPSSRPTIDTTAKTHRISSLFKLNGTVSTSIDGKEEMLAVISGGGLDGRAIRIGQKVRVANGNGSYDIYKLIRVGSRFVVWQPEGTDEEITMRVEEVL